jgi:hypothetical protein
LLRILDVIKFSVLFIRITKFGPYSANFKAILRDSGDALLLTHAGGGPVSGIIKQAAQGKGADDN